MQNKYLEGNTIIEEAIAAAQADGFSAAAVDGLIAALQQRMGEDGHLLLPIEQPDENDPNHYLLRSLPNEEGDLFLACFTSEEELRKGQETGVLSQFLDVFLTAAVDLEEARGIVINPWSGGCRIPKTILQIVLEAKPPREDDYLRENRLLEKAIRFATERHAGQLRKGTTTPYILHPLETMDILRQMGADRNLLMAGVLHDTLEDTDATFTDLVEQFGTDVAALVSAHSEDKSKSWEERKQAAIDHLRRASHRMQMLVMADKVANLRSMAADFRQVGDRLWERFNAPKARQSWYYSGIQDALWQMQDDPHTECFYWELVAFYKELFVGYYRSENTLLQLSDHGEAYVLQKGEHIWQIVSSPDLRDLTPVTRQAAEALEDEWTKSRQETPAALIQ